MRFFITTFILALAVILVGSVLAFDPDFEKINTFTASVKNKQETATTRNTATANTSTASATHANNQRSAPARSERTMMSSSSQTDKVYDLCVTVLPNCAQMQERRRVCNCAANQAKIKFTQTDWDYFQYVSYHQGGFSIQAPASTPEEARNAADLGEKLNTAIESCR